MADFRMPAEWEPHERCLLAWPTRASLWGPHVVRAKQEYAATIDAIAAFEPVTLVVTPGQAPDARATCTASIEIVELAIDDSWLRDAGPIITIDDSGRRRGVDFVFNSWGERFLPYDDDAAVGAAILAHLGIEREASTMVLEGGAITVDGEGTLITTEQCLLHPNRNPTLDRAAIERELERTLGVTTVIWLPWGGYDDEHTDGHVDGVCTYVRPGVVLAQTCPDPDDPNHALMSANLAVLEAARDAAGRPLEIIEMPYLPYVDLAGDRLVVSYPNFYVANGGVIVPTAGRPIDDDALAIIAAAFPAREVVGVPSPVIAYGGGGTHCITQQVPCGRAA